MGLLQKACETYDANRNLIGLQREGHKGVLAPIGHLITQADIEITINAKGKFLAARSVDKTEPKIIIPVTEESAGRTSSPCAHPLCDQIGYVAPYNETKHGLYMDQLLDWAGSDFTHPKVKAIAAYCEGKTIMADLHRSGIVSAECLRASQGKGSAEDEKALQKIEKDLICWVVSGLKNDSGPVWKDQSLFQAYQAWYERKIEDRGEKFCMLSGEESVPALQHLKGIIPKNGNAKLISANDSSGFTYRGRFLNDSQAMSLSYEAGQKAHCALRWLADEQGVSEGKRTFLCWNPKGRNVPALLGPLRRAGSPTVTEPTDYRKELQRTLAGYQSELPEDMGGVVLAAFDAATTGRLSLTYYNELRSSDFLTRLEYWDSSCCWYNGRWGIQSPSLYQLVKCAFGTERKERGMTSIVVDDSLLPQQIQRLLSCRIDKALFPADIERALVERASSPQAYKERESRNEVLFTACCAIRKYYFDHKKEELSMALEPERKDRSYQFGRLLAVMEKAEADTYKEREERETNAIKMQPVFCRRPLYASKLVIEQLKKAYYPRLRSGSRGYYEKLIMEIFQELSAFPETELDRPLGDTYLIGYYLQKKDLYTSKRSKENEEE